MSSAKDELCPLPCAPFGVAFLHHPSCPLTFLWGLHPRLPNLETPAPLVSPEERYLSASICGGLHRNELNPKSKKERHQKQPSSALQFAREGEVEKYLEFGELLGSHWICLTWHQEGGANSLTLFLLVTHSSRGSRVRSTIPANYLTILIISLHSSHSFILLGFCSTPG